VEGWSIIWLAVIALGIVLFIYSLAGLATRALGGGSFREREWSVDRLSVLVDRMDEVLHELKAIRSLLETPKPPEPVRPPEPIRVPESTRVPDERIKAPDERA
jgi:hypothetical protein